MNKLFLIMLLSTFSMNNNLFSQGNREITGIKKVLAKELFLVNEFYGGRVIINKFDNYDTNYVRINNIRELHGEYTSFSSDYDAFLVNVSFINITARKTKFNLDTVNFEYVIISKFGYSFYKLLGFSTIDATYISHEIYTYKEDSKTFLNWIADILIKDDILNSKEANYFVKSLLKEEYTYDKRMNKPVNLINIIHPNRLYQSLIIPYSWLF
ncbi:MAG: hypothetical protein ABI207_02310 [Crocinitomicaceae bacterium]